MNSVQPTPPPPTAPPVVPPPLPEQFPPDADRAAVAVTRSPLQRFVRDLKLAGFCLLIGWLVGQSGVLERLLRTSTAQSAPTVAAAVSAASLADDQNVSDLPDDPAANLPSEASNSPSHSSPQLDRTHGGDVPSLSAKPVSETSSPASESPSESPSESAGEQAIESPAVQAATELASDSSAGPTAAMEPSATAPESTPESTARVGQATASRAKTAPAVTATMRPTSESIASMLTMAAESSLAHPAAEDAACQNMESHGTVLKWADTPADAYRIAAEQSKLVYMIHVSGNFEIPGFT